MNVTRLGGLPLVALLGAFLLVGCGDDGPSGPGTVRAIVEAPTPMGGAIVELRGSGISGIRGAGTTVFSSAVGSDGSVHRVVVVRESSGSLSFDFDLSDVGTLPRGTVVEAVDGSDDPLPTLGGIDVRMRVR